MKQESFLKDAMILFLITLVAGLSLGGVHELTKGPIQRAAIEAKRESYQLVYPAAADFRASDDLQEAVDTATELLTKESFGNVVIGEMVEALDADNEVSGYVVSAASKDGYGGAISISVGVDQDNVVTGIEFLSIEETPGLGMNATNPEFKDQFKGKTVDSFHVGQGGSADNTVDALSGATITSKAVANAVNAALFCVYHYRAQ